MLIITGCFIATTAVVAVALEATFSAACLGALAFFIIVKAS